MKTTSFLMYSTSDYLFAMYIKFQTLLILFIFILGTIGCGSSVNIPKPQLSKSQEPSPIELSLVNIPVSPCIAPFSGTGQSVSTSIGVVAKPMIVFGQKPSVQNTPLPEFNLNSPQAGSHVVLEGNLPFDAASKILSILNPPKVNPNSPPLLFGSINAIHPVGVYSNSDSFHIVVIVDGNVSLNLDNTL